MAIGDVAHLFLTEESTEENWKKFWPLLRKNTATEVHEVDLVSVDADEIVLRMEIGDHARQPFGLLHGGISMMLAESAASMHSCWGLDIPAEHPVGIEITGSHMRSASEGAVLVKATVLRRSKTLVHHDVRVVEEATGRELSVIRVTNLIRRVGGSSTS